MPRFVAVDGEADKQGRYIILCDSTGRTLYNPSGITTVEAFEFLLDLNQRGTVVVCFGLNYDMNQWLADVPRRELERLAEHGQMRHKLRYKVKWVPSKFVEITDKRAGRHVKICEVFGFFQSSFIKALEQWGLEVPQEIETMKQARGTFTRAQLEAVIHYCQHECRLLVQLMDRLANACQSADCMPSTWIGAGSIASKLLRSNGVKELHAFDKDLTDRQTVEDYILGSYFGGRVEMLTQGLIGDCTTLDIRSAYPAAATYLPTLADATVKHRKRYVEHDWCIWHVRWDKQVVNRLGPFPVRQHDKSICYPASGEGFYHGVEVASAIRCGYNLTIQSGIQLQPATAVQPFAWIPDTFKHRAAMKAAGDPAEKALKLGLNSVYGKLAQGYGHPPFQNYWWAGHITAATRARMLALAVRAGGVCMISTDGLFATRTDLRSVDIGTALGEWESDAICDLFCAQPGVYDGLRGSNPVIKSRGFFAKEVDYGQLRREYIRRGTDGAFSYDSRRFIGLRVALHRKDFGVWRQWVTERRTISLNPERKSLVGRPRINSRYRSIELHPLPGPVTSIPYTPKESLYDDPTDEALENMVLDDQPHLQCY